MYVEETKANPNPESHTPGVNQVDTPGNSAQSDLAGTTPANADGSEPTPSSPKVRKPFLVVGVVVLLLALAGGGYFLWQNSQKQTTPTSTSEPTASQAPNGELADWKIYTLDSLSLQFKHPNGWFVSESGSSQFPNIRIQNYDPATAPGRGYSELDDQGKYLLNVTRYPAGDGIHTLDGLVTTLPKEGDSAIQLGDDAGSIKILQEKRYEINGYPALTREVTYSKLPDTTNTYTYMLDNKGGAIMATPGLDVKGGKNITDQILSTFKFIDPNEDISHKCGVCGPSTVPGVEAACPEGLVCKEDPSTPGKMSCVRADEEASICE